MSGALIATLAWLLAALSLGFVPLRWRVATGWALAALGVPVLGWLTLGFGPFAGGAALATGLALLHFAPRLRGG